MFKCILNGIFTEDYFLDSVKFTMAQFVLNKNSPGLRNKIKAEIHKLLHKQNVHYHKTKCDDEDMNLINLHLELQPTILSFVNKWDITMPLYHWESSLITSFNDDQLIEIYTTIPFTLSRSY